MSRSVKFSVAGRVGLVVGLLLFLSFVTGTVSYVLTKRIEDDMARLAGVDDVRHHAVVDMRFRLAEVRPAGRRRIPLHRGRDLGQDS